MRKLPDNKKFFAIEVGVLFYLLVPNPTVAQIVPDTTLPNNSIVTVQGNSNNISGGTRAGNNLFHSFSEFSVHANGVAYFNNALDVQNIISRVTGGSVSNIDGLLKANGTANLFLINPIGIVFGSNASLNIGGSFLGTTANSINFADGTQFSATTPQATPLLTISVPIGLGIWSNAGAIRVQGTGHELVDPSYLPITGRNSSTGLSVQPGKTLALIGGDVFLDGGILTAPGGQIDLGSVNNGRVSFIPTAFGWNLGYQDVSSFKDLRLSQQALLNASGPIGGSIGLQGRAISVNDGSLILIQNQGLQPSGDISVNASDSLEVSGTSPDGRIPSTLSAEALGTGQAGNIGISTKFFELQDGGSVSSRSYSNGKSGNVTINASESVRVLDFSPVNLRLFSNLAASTFSSGDGGNLTVNTKRLTVRNGGNVATSTLGNGQAGNINVKATDLVDITGVTPVLSTPSNLTSVAYSAGKAGSLTINTSRLRVRDGGAVAASTVATGDAGSLIINASDSIDVSGTALESQRPSLISASTVILNEALQQLLRLPERPSGSSGDITINTGQLRVTNGGQVSVRNDGPRDAGKLQINARSIFLDNQGGIIASTASGAGGNIFLNVDNQLNLNHNSIISATAGDQGKGGNITIDPQTTSISNGSGITVNSTGTGNAGQLNISSNNLTLNNGSFLSANTNGGEGGNIFLNAQNLQLRHSSLFTAAAQASGNGGNISINTGTLAVLENSPITANAYQGRGGNIQINAQGIFRSPDSLITASSQLGINGTVQVNTLVNNSTLGLVRLPIVPVDAAKLIAQGCGGNAGPRGNKFVVTGSGGFPSSPTDSQDIDRSESDWGTTNAPSGENHASAYHPSKSHNDDDDDFVEATGAIRNAKGQIELVANAPTYTPSVPWIKSPSCHAR